MIIRRKASNQKHAHEWTTVHWGKKSKLEEALSISAVYREYSIFDYNWLRCKDEIQQ